jgi:hypothetical protein
MFKFKKKYNKKNYREISLESDILNNFSLIDLSYAKSFLIGFHPIYNSNEIRFKFEEDIWIKMFFKMQYSRMEREMLELINL